MQMAAAAMSKLLRLRCITLDVTGTLMAYKGELGDYYCMSAKAVGLNCPDYHRVHEGFKAAYADMARKFPCFGWGTNMSNREWWRLCVRNSFTKAGYCYDEDTFDKVFHRIYAIFGSTAPYTVFPDAQPFLRWARSKGFVVAILSNAEERYRDIILPALGLHQVAYLSVLNSKSYEVLQQGSEWDVGIFSGIEGIEKPDPRIYKLALERCGNVPPELSLHIGDSWRKDYASARSVGMQSVLLDRFDTPEAKSWKENGALVFPDLHATRQWIEQNCQIVTSCKQKN